MHEYPVTLEIIRLAEKTAEENHGRVRGIHLVIGEDSGFIGESIQMYFDVLAAGTLCEGAQVTIEGVKPKLSCEKCGKLFERKRFSFTCPFCGGSGTPTETGKEFYIKMWNYSWRMKAMHMVKKEVLLDINGRNDHIAQHVKEHLEERHIFAVNIMGAPGAGKTTSLENLIRALPVKSYVIEGDIESDIDTERLKNRGFLRHRSIPSAPAILMRLSCTMLFIIWRWTKEAYFLLRM